MLEILLATGNKRKLGEARVACDDFGIQVNQLKLEIDEIQHHDHLEISKRKALDAYKLVDKPIVVTDTSWNIPALNGFPGGYMKDVSAWFAPEDFIHLLKNKSDRRVSFTETIVYKDSKQIKLFSQEYWGVVIDTPRGHGESIEQVAEFEGVTLAERRDQGGFSHDPKEYVWYKFAQWYTNRDTL